MKHIRGLGKKALPPIQQGRSSERSQQVTHAVVFDPRSSEFTSTTRRLPRQQSIVVRNCLVSSLAQVGGDQA